MAQYDRQTVIAGIGQIPGNVVKKLHPVVKNVCSRINDGDTWRRAHGIGHNFFIRFVWRNNENKVATFPWRDRTTSPTVEIDPTHVHSGIGENVNDLLLGAVQDLRIQLDLITDSNGQARALLWMGGCRESTVKCYKGDRQPNSGSPRLALPISAGCAYRDRRN